MKAIVIGGVAAGPKTAARIVRMHPEAKVTIIEKGEFLSYAGCGLPYYISGVVGEQKELMNTSIGVVRDPNFFKNVKNVKVLNRTEAIAINRSENTVTILKPDGSKEDLPYDKLVLATGAKAVKPAIPGIELKNIFNLQKIEDAEAIKAILKDKGACNALIVGGGLIGVETAEALSTMGCKVTIVEMLPQILKILDPELIAPVETHFAVKGVRIMTNTKVLAFEGEKDSVENVVTDKEDLKADLVVLAIGVQPNTKLAELAGLELGDTNAIKVDPEMKTSDSDIFAVGDCVENINIVSGKPCFVPLGSTANKHGRVAANNISGIKDEFPGVLGSTVCKIFDFTVARTGLGESEAAWQGYETATCLMPGPDKPHFMPEAKPVFLKLIADRNTRRLLGAQGVGLGNADKRIDAAAVAISAGMTVDQIANLDLCYAPPYSPAMDNIITAANVLRNVIDGHFQQVTAAEVKKKLDRNDDFTLLDVRSPGEYEEMHIEKSKLVPLGTLRGKLDELDKSHEYIIYCKSSLRAYEAAMMMKHANFKNISVMPGGIVMWPYKKVKP